MHAACYAFSPTATDTTDTINGLNQIMLNGLTTVTYDARGNLINHGSSTYSYSADNQLLTGPNGTGMTWDALGCVRSRGLLDILRRGTARAVTR